MKVTYLDKLQVLQYLHWLKHYPIGGIGSVSLRMILRVQSFESMNLIFDQELADPHQENW